MTSRDLEKEFKNRMLISCQKMAEILNENLSNVYSWIEKNGGVEAIRNLIKQYPDYRYPPERFKNLSKIHKLELSFEALMVKSEFESLFTDHELNWTISRLRLYGYNIPIRGCVCQAK